MDQVRSVRQQPLALVERLIDQAVVVLLQIAEAAVDQLRRLRGCPRREVLGLDQRRPQASGGRVERHPATRDPAPDDQHVELLGRQPGQGLVAIEGDGCRHGPSRYRPPLA